MKGYIQSEIQVVFFNRNHVFECRYKITVNSNLIIHEIEILYNYENIYARLENTILILIEIHFIAAVFTLINKSI